MCFTGLCKGLTVREKWQALLVYITTYLTIAE